MSFSFVSFVFCVFLRCVKLSGSVKASWSTWPLQRLWKPWRTWSLTLKTWDQVLYTSCYFLLKRFHFILIWISEFKVDAVGIWLMQLDSWQRLFAWMEFIVIMDELFFCFVFKRLHLMYDLENWLFVIYLLFY